MEGGPRRTIRGGSVLDAEREARLTQRRRPSAGEAPAAPGAGGQARGRPGEAVTFPVSLRKGRCASAPRRRRLSKRLKKTMN